ncbi:hypothetical protein D3C75_1318920 [compost metagenome]
MVVGAFTEAEGEVEEAPSASSFPQPDRTVKPKATLITTPTVFLEFQFIAMILPFLVIADRSLAFHLCFNRP